MTPPLITQLKYCTIVGGRTIALSFVTKSRGLIASLNRGCRLAKGKYIAWMDADDICDVRRLETQVSFLEAHPEIGIVGSGVLIVDEQGEVIHHQAMPTRPALIHWHLAFENCFVNSSVMMRRDVAQSLNYYSPGVLLAEDYDLWSRALVVTRLTNLPDVSVQRREWGGNISTVRFSEMELTACTISRSILEGILGRAVDVETVACARRFLVLRQPPRSMEEVRSVALLCGICIRITKQIVRLRRTIPGSWPGMLASSSPDWP